MAIEIKLSRDINPDTGIQRACDVLGGQEKMAKALGVTQQRVSQMIQDGYAPIKHVQKISRLTNVPKSKLVDPELAALVNTTLR